MIKVLVEEQPRRFQDASPGHFVFSIDGVMRSSKGIFIKLKAPVSGYNAVNFLGELEVVDPSQEVCVVSFRSF